MLLLILAVQSQLLQALILVVAGGILPELRTNLRRPLGVESREIVPQLGKVLKFEHNPIKCSVLKV